MKKVIFFLCFTGLFNVLDCNAQNYDFHDCQILELVLKDSSVRSFFNIDDDIAQPVNLNDANNYFKCSFITVNGKTHKICSGFSCGPIKFFIGHSYHDSLKMGLVDLRTGEYADLYVIRKHKKYVLSRIKFGYPVE